MLLLFAIYIGCGYDATAVEILPLLCDPDLEKRCFFAKTGDSFAHIENRKENGYSFSFPFAAFLRGFGLVSS